MNLSVKTKFNIGDVVNRYIESKKDGKLELDPLHYVIIAINVSFRNDRDKIVYNYTLSSNVKNNPPEDKHKITGALEEHLTLPIIVKKKCPKCGGTYFYVTAHVTQDWEVDGNGNFFRALNSCSEVTHSPDDDDVWDCANCGYSAAGAEFNVKAEK